MSLFNCNCKCSCTAAAVSASSILGVVTAFLQITGVITVAPVFLWVALGIAVGYLAVLTVATALARGGERCSCTCTALNTLLAGIFGDGPVRSGTVGGRDRGYQCGERHPRGIAGAVPFADRNCHSLLCKVLG